MRFVIFILFLLLTAVNVFPQDNNTPVPFTLGDRDRLMRNEQKIETVRTEMNVRFESVDRRFDNIQKDMNTRFDSVNSRIDDVKEQMGFMTTLLIFVLGGLMSLIGFVIYDRRTAIKPVQRSQEKLEDILVEYSKENKKLREILKNAGIL